MEYLTLLSILTTSICCEAVNAHNFRWLIDSALAASFGFKSSGGGVATGTPLLIAHLPSPLAGIDSVQFVSNHCYRFASIES
jgi:hypothetical protein